MNNPVLSRLIRASRIAITLTALTISTASGETGSNASAHIVGPHNTRFPIIGTAAYSASCILSHYVYDDGSIDALCTEDGQRYRYDPDGQPYQNTSGIPIRQPGWYAIGDSGKGMRMG